LDVIDKAIEEVILTEEQIALRIAELGKEITDDYTGKSLLVMCVLKGSVFFLADITRQIDPPLEFEFVKISRYRGERTPQGEPKNLDPWMPDLKGKHVLLVEDILDTGETMKYAVDLISNSGAESVRTCVLLAKEGYKNCCFPDPDYVGFCIPDVFVVGYGLDYREKFRNLRYVAKLREDFCGGNE